MPRPILLLAIGNESRGDDALGPLLARRLDDWLETVGMREQVEVIEDFQLQIEHTLDLVERELVLFVDAGQDTPSPFSFYEAKAKRLEGHTTHAVAPETLLGIYPVVHDVAPPPAFILCVAGMAFDLGEPLSPEATRHLEAAFAFCQRLFAQPRKQAWQGMAGISSNHEAGEEKQMKEFAT
jgi:hydrogenase maturation protease